MSQFDLSGKRVLISGSARGLGAGMAEAMTAAGARVMISDVLKDAGEETAAGLKDAGFVELDVTDDSAWERAVAHTVSEFGGLDVLVNNAGILHMAPLLEIDVADWDRTFAINVRSMLLTIQAAVPFMQEAGGGKIVNMASMGGKLGAPGQAHYCASKAAVIELTRVAAMELGPLGITVNCICPGYVLTDMGAATRTPEMVTAWTAKSPLGRLGSPQDVAAMALFLASADGDYCTGQAMNVTGGMVMH